MHIQHAYCSIVGPDPKKQARESTGSLQVSLSAIYSQVQGCMWAVLRWAGRPCWAALGYAQVWRHP